MKFKIEKNIPIPESKWHYSKFPFDKMEIGDSFFVKPKDIDADSKITAKSRVYQSYRKFLMEKESIIRLSIRTDKLNNGIRIFRTK